MKFLFVSDLLPYREARHAGGTTVFHHIRFLAEQGHEVSLITYHDKNEQVDLTELKACCRELALVACNRPVREKLLRLPLLVPYSRECWRVVHDRAFSARLKQMLARIQPDVVQFEEPWMFSFAKHVTSARTVLDEQDIFFLVKYRRFLKEKSPFMRALRFVDFVKMLWFEERCIRKADLVFTRSEKDRQFLRTLIPRCRPEVLDPWVSGDALSDIPLVPPREKVILFFGAMDREVNIEGACYFHDEIFPLVKQKVPDARFVISGAHPPDRILRLAGTPDVCVTGFVEDLRQVYEGCRVLVAPLLIGGGVIVKVLDAMAAGRPVVTTNLGNEGIRAEPGREISVADTPAPFAEAVVRLLEDDRAWELAARRAREFCMERYCWDAITRKLLANYVKLLTGQQNEAIP